MPRWFAFACIHANMSLSLCVSQDFMETTSVQLIIQVFGTKNGHTSRRLHLQPKHYQLQLVENYGELDHWSGGYFGQSMLTSSQVSHRPKLNKASKHPKFMEQQYFQFLVNQLAMNTCIWGQYVWETLHNFETPHLTLQQQIFSTKAQLFTSNKMRCPYIFGPLRGLQMGSAPVSPVALRPWSRRKVWRDQLPY